MGHQVFEGDTGPEKKQRALLYAFRLNTLDYLFIINPDTKTKNKELEIYSGPADALKKSEGGENRKEGLHTPFGLLKFPQERINPYDDKNANADFRIMSSGGMRGGYQYPIQVNRLDPAELPQDLFELLNIPVPVPVKFALKKTD